MESVSNDFLFRCLEFFGRFEDGFLYGTIVAQLFPLKNRLSIRLKQSDNDNDGNNTVIHFDRRTSTER